MCFPAKEKLYCPGMVHDLAKVEMCYSARVERLPIRMLQGLDMEEPQSLGFLAAEAQAKNEAGHAFSNGQLPNGACLRWEISVSMFKQTLAFED